MGWKTPQDKKSTIISEKDDGGLKMVAFLFMSKSLKATWAARFFDENKAPWKITPEHLGGFKFLLSCNYKFEELPLNELPPFYLNILQYWEEIRHVTESKDTTTLNEIIIWNNSDIKGNGKTIYYQPWHCKGVTKVVDLLDNQDRFLAFDAFNIDYFYRLLWLNSFFSPTQD